MALTIPTRSQAARASARSFTDRGLADDLQEGRWSVHVLRLLVVSGAATVIAGSYATWATFYGGLIARDGVSGHGKYFIGLALATMLAVTLSRARGVWGGLRWLAVPAGMAIAAVALRDLRNLDALVRDPATGFYLPGRGDGLFVVLAGALILMLAPLARPVGDAGGASMAGTVVALAAVAGVAMLTPGLYGEYYLHVAHGHAQGHTEALNSAHVLTAGGGLLLLATSHARLVGALRRGGRR